MTDSSFRNFDRVRAIEAQRHAPAGGGFRVHLAAFWIVMTGLVFLNLADHRVWWVQWPLLGWGIGVLAHGIAVLSKRNRRVSSQERALLAQRAGRSTSLPITEGR